LQAILRIEDDSTFDLAFRRFLLTYGLSWAFLTHGEFTPIGNGYRMRTSAIDSTTWVFYPHEEESVKLPKEFGVFLFDADGIKVVRAMSSSPDRTLVFVSLGDHGVIVDTSDGKMTLIGSASINGWYHR